MKISKRTFLSILATTLVFSSLALMVNVNAVTLKNSQSEQIRSNCVSIKNTINQLHASDALLRVNMGQIYESMLTKVMNRFNDRLASNKLDNSALVQASGNFSQSLTSFRLDYKNYEEQLSSLIGIDCLSQPANFYEALLSARSKRTQVHTDVIKIIQYKNQYSSALDKFMKDYQNTKGGN